MSKRKKRSVRAEPQTQVAVCLDSYFDDLCTSGYVRLSDNAEIQSAVNKIADLISSMTIYLMENTEDGDVRIKDELAKLIDIYPNPNMTRKTFIYAIVKTLLLKGSGNCVAIPTTSAVNGYIERIDIIPPSYVTISPNGAFDYYVLINGIAYNPSDLLHFVINPDEEMPYKGTGYRAALKDIAQNLKQANKTVRGFMESKWKPPVIIKVDALAEELSTEDGRAKILEKYISDTDGGRPWVIPAETIDVQTVKPLSLTDLAISESVNIDKKTVAAILGVPPFIVGAGDYKKEEWDNFINSRIKPLCNAIEQELTRKLLISPRRYFKFNLRSLYSYDLQAISAVGMNMYSRGLMLGNEVRDWLDLSPLEGLNELVILENYIPQGMIADQKKLKGGEGSE